MIPLPICRWRKEVIQGQYLCESAKYCDPPNLVAAKFCAKCCCADHEPPPPLPQAMPCVHLGGLVARNGQDRGAKSKYSDEQFVCALHGRCTIMETDQRRPTQNRSCGNCSDYLARDPFGPNSAQMLRQAEDFLTAVPAYPKGRYQGRGVVIAGGGDRFFPALYITVRALRHLGSSLPIQVWYLGRKREMPAKRKALLAPFQVECVDADKVRRCHPARRLDGWELKVFAALHSPFEELLCLDADCYPCRNPDFLFELEDYRARGAIFWPDIPTIDARLMWPAFRVPDPRRLGSVESGQFVLDKRFSWRPLNLAWFYNDHSDYYYRYCHGDKHTFEVAWARCARPFVMWEPKAQWVDVAYLQVGPDRVPLFVHRCSDKFRFENLDYTTLQYHPLPSFYSSLPLERECWDWLAELARLTGRKLPNQEATKLLGPPKRPRPDRARFAIATLYTPEIADLGVRTSRVMAAYAKRHGYRAVIAKDRIDASRPAAWSKLLLIERYLAENPACAWLMWIDADAVITNPMQRLEDLVDENVDFLVAKDQSAFPINTGVFLVRNCPPALDMFRRAYAKVEYIHHPWWEQPAIAEALRECAPTLRTRIVSRRLFNSFAGEHRKGDFIVHFAGCSPEVKLAGVKEAVASATRPSRRSLSVPPAPETVHDLLPLDARSLAAGVPGDGESIGGDCFPDEVPGWFTRAECRLWSEACRDRNVLELGRYHGRSTVAAAQTAHRVVSLDNASEQPADAWLRRYGVRRKVWLRQGLFADLTPTSGGPFSACLIDGDHSRRSVKADIAAVVAHLAPKAVIGFHDYGDPAHPDVKPVVDAAAERFGWRLVGRADYLALFATADQTEKGPQLRKTPAWDNDSRGRKAKKTKTTTANSQARAPLIIQTWNAGSTIDLQSRVGRLFPRTPKLGMVIGTFAAVPYIHLQLEARRRFYPDLPLLVHDDASHEIEALSSLCQQYGCDFEHNDQRQSLALGDLTAFVGGLNWAAARGVDILVKASRRWLFQTNWQPSLKALAVESQYATFASYTTSYDFGFRTECVGMAVAVWKNGDFLDDALHYLALGRSVFMEAYIHEFARRYEKKNCEAAEQWRKAHPMAENRNGYALWTLLGTDRCQRSPFFLWHDTSAPQDYLEIARKWGLPYTLDDFADPDRGARPVL